MKAKDDSRDPGGTREAAALAVAPRLFEHCLRPRSREWVGQLNGFPFSMLSAHEPESEERVVRNGLPGTAVCHFVAA